MLKNSKVTLARSSMATKPNPLEGKEVDEERVGMDGKGKRLGPPNPAALYFFLESVTDATEARLVCP